jgi:hypothetical protein
MNSLSSQTKDFLKAYSFSTDFASNGKIDKKKLLLRDCGMEKEERVISDFL